MACGDAVNEFNLDLLIFCLIEKTEDVIEESSDLKLSNRMSEKKAEKREKTHDGMSVHTKFNVLEKIFYITI